MTLQKSTPAQISFQFYKILQGSFFIAIFLGVYVFYMMAKVVYVKEYFFKFQADLRVNFHTTISYELGFLEIVSFEIYLQNLTSHSACQFEQKFRTGIHFCKLNKRNAITMLEICSKSTIKVLERRRRRFGVFIVNFEQFSQYILVFTLLTLNKQTPA